MKVRAQARHQQVDRRLVHAVAAEAEAERGVLVSSQLPVY